ncbi:MAG TPA: cytochrome C [Burkholderiales bacterium]|nr:cytochrome C [Burkholderiales bacterium]
MGAARVVAGMLLVAVLPAEGADIPSVERGRLLYENHCVVCHTPNIHRRPNRVPLNAAELRDIVNGWQREEKLRWSEQDVADVVQYLRETRYKF